MLQVLQPALLIVTQGAAPDDELSWGSGYFTLFNFIYLEKLKKNFN